MRACRLFTRSADFTLNIVLDCSLPLVRTCSGTNMTSDFFSQIMKPLGTGINYVDLLLLHHGEWRRVEGHRCFAPVYALT